MQHEFTPELEQQLQELMATGSYQSENQLLESALRALKSEHESIAAINEGLEDLQQGRVRPLNEVADEIRQKHGWSH